MELDHGRRRVGLCSATRHLGTTDTYVHAHLEERREARGFGGPTPALRRAVRRHAAQACHSPPVHTTHMQGTYILGMHLLRSRLGRVPRTGAQGCIQIVIDDSAGCMHAAASWGNARPCLKSPATRRLACPSCWPLIRRGSESGTTDVNIHAQRDRGSGLHECRRIHGGVSVCGL